MNYTVRVNVTPTERNGDEPKILNSIPQYRIKNFWFNEFCLGSENTVCNNPIVLNGVRNLNILKR